MGVLMHVLVCKLQRMWRTYTPEDVADLFHWLAIE